MPSTNQRRATHAGDHTDRITSRDGNVIGVDFGGGSTGDADFDIGDVVMLRSGGFPMTVVGSCPECGDVEVCWYTGDDLAFDVLPADAVEIVEPVSAQVA